MHILLVHQAFASHNEAGGTRHYELSQYLIRKKHRIIVITSAINYLTGQKSSKRENIDGIDLHHVKTYQNSGSNFLSRVLSFMSFMVLSLLDSIKTKKIDIIWGTSPHLFQGLTAYLTARLKSVPFVFEIRDLWPDFAIETGVLKSRFLIRLSRWLEQFLYKHSDCLVVNSPGFLPHLQCYSPDEKIQVVSNGVESALFNPADRGENIRRELGLEGKFIVLYAGAHGLANDLGTLLETAQMVKNNPHISFLLIGDGKEKQNLIQRAKELQLINVQFVAAQSKNNMPAFLAVADVCVAILKAIPIFTTTYPNKVFDYMAAGRPTLLVIDGVIRQVIEAADGGVFVKPGNPEALANMIIHYSITPDLCLRQGQKARSYVCTHFQRQKQAEKLELIFEKTIQQRKQAVSHNLGHSLKRVLDVIISFTVLTLCLPLILVISMIIRWTLGLPIFFRQARPGEFGRVFSLLKFRTMNNVRNVEGHLLPDRDRLSGFGKFLRRTSLDELPEFYNVLRGEMSLVGPRPLLMEYLERYTPEQARRHAVKPGITGLAQVKGRNSITWEEKFKWDLWYIDRWSFWLDLKILGVTIVQVLRQRGISSSGYATTPQFEGVTNISGTVKNNQ